MAKNERRHQRKERKRLPLTTDLKPGEKQNITELTAIARIKPGMYPEERLKLEIKVENKQKKWLATQFVPGIKPEITWLKYLKAQENPKMTWLDHFRAVLGWAHVNRQSKIRNMRTIHYARWVVLDPDFLPGLDGPHLLFTSNYDSELDGYLEDFATIDEGPLNLIFGHCVEWPGARPAKKFIEYVKEHEHPASLFYANYPRATVGDVNRALDWKEKTEKFIQRLEKLHDKPPSQWEAAARKYVNDLTTPTP